MSGAIKDFTATVPRWSPYLSPLDASKATPEQRDSFKETPSNTKVSDYVLVLAHDPQSLAERTPLYNAIMFGRGGLPRAERELSAVAASMVNRCVYCAAVHASRYTMLTKRPEVMERVFADGAAAKLEAREQAILGFAMKLSETPPRADEDDVAALKAAGLSEPEIVDAILAASMFGWANRLMHSLGEPLPAGTGGAATS